MADSYEGGNRSQFVVEANQSALQREDSVTQSVQDARALGDLTRYTFTAQGLLITLLIPLTVFIVYPLLGAGAVIERDYERRRPD